MTTMSKANAIAIYNSGEWKHWSDEERAVRQLFQPVLFMEFSVFHASLERVLQRGIVIPEFVFNLEGLKQELLETVEFDTNWEEGDDDWEEQEGCYPG